MAEEKDTTIGFKGSSELKQEIDQLVNQSGKNKKEFFEELINIYKSQESKNLLQRHSNQISKLDILTRRINEMFLEMARDADDLVLENQTNIENLRSTNQKTIQTLQDQINKLKSELKEANTIKETVQKDNANLSKRNSELESLHKSNLKEINFLETEKLNLVEKLKNYGQFKSNYDKLTVDLSNTSRNLKEANKQTESQKEMIKRLEADYLLQLEQQRKEADFVLKEEIRKIREEYNQVINKIKEDYNEKIEVIRSDYSDKLEACRVEKAEITELISQLKSEIFVLTKENSLLKKSIKNEPPHSSVHKIY